MEQILTPWTTDGKVLRDREGRSVASGCNNTYVVGEDLAACLELATRAVNSHGALIKACCLALGALYAKGGPQTKEEQTAYEAIVSALDQAQQVQA